MPTNLLIFLPTILALALIPGVNSAVITRQVIDRGPRAGLWTVAGTSTGILAWATASALGISSVLLTTPAAHTVLRLGGAALLVALGVITICQSISRASAAEDRMRDDGSESRRGRSFLVGIGSSLGNPKAGIVAIALLPQFVTAHGPIIVTMTGLGVLWACISGTWFVFYVWLIHRFRTLLHTPRATAILKLCMGCGMVALGVGTAML